MKKASLGKILLIAAVFCLSGGIAGAADKPAEDKKPSPVKAPADQPAPAVKIPLINVPLSEKKKPVSREKKEEEPAQVVNISLFTINNIAPEEKPKKEETVSIVKGTDFEVTSLYDLWLQTRKWWDEILKWFGRQQTNILVLFAGVLITLAITTFFGWFFKKIVLGIVARRTDSQIDDKVCESLKRPLVLLIFTVGVFLSSLRLLNGLDEEVFVIVLRSFFALMALAVIWGIYRLVEVLDFYLKRLSLRSDNNLDDLLVELIIKAMRFTIVFIAVFFIGQTILGLQITALMAGAGIAGLALALAAKDTLANFFGSMMIMLDKPFVVGERIKIDTLDGVVEKVGFRSTRIRSLTGHVYSVPNNKIADSVVENVAKRPYIKYMFDLTLVYDTRVEQMERAMEILHELLDNHEAFNAELPPRIYFTAFNDWSLNINIILWFQSTDYFQVQQWKNDINLEILRRFNAAGLEFAFPTSTNYLVAAETAPAAIPGRAIKT
ncbi:MAG: mechanosensitive ion channel family protein [Victivallaceae bacterium]|nr:mechanosensitive ion channel family protein [Victivallaceae bacterium]